MNIQLGSHKSIDSINVDNNNIIGLTNKIRNFEDFELNLFANSSEIFENEYDLTEKYRLYGSIEYISILNGLEIKTLYRKSDLFKPFYDLKDYDKKYYDIFNSFDIYVVIPTKYNISLGNNKYIRQFEVVCKPEDIVIQNVGFDNNVYGDKGYYFQINNDVDLKYFDVNEDIEKIKYETYENFNYPITDFYLYFKFKDFFGANIMYNNWLNNPTKSILTQNNINIGDYIYGDVVEINPENFSKEIIKNQTYYFNLSVEDKIMVNKYNPFLPIKIKKYSEELHTENINNTSYIDINQIPEYAFNIDNSGNYVWRTLNNVSNYIDENNVVNTPFINNRKYLFNKLLLNTVPDISDLDTKILFDEIITPNKFLFINNTPTNDINKLGKTC